MSWNILYGYTSYVDKNCANDQIISLGPEGSIGTNISKNSCFQVEKGFWPLLLVSSSVTNIREHFIRVQKLFWHLLWKIKERFLRTRRLLKTQSFEKKAIFPVRKRFGSIFSRNIEYDKCQETIYTGPQGVLITIVQMIKTFLWDLRGRWKQTIQEKLFQKWQKFLAFFPRIIECDKHQGVPDFLRVQRYSEKIFKMIRSFLWDLRCR